MVRTKRIRAPVKEIGYGVYLYFLGLSYRKTAKKALSRFIKKGAMYQFGNGYGEIQSSKISYKRRIPEFVVDKTQIKVGNSNCPTNLIAIRFFIKAEIEIWLKGIIITLILSNREETEGAWGRLKLSHWRLQNILGISKLNEAIEALSKILLEI